MAYETKQTRYANRNPNACDTHLPLLISLLLLQICPFVLGHQQT